MTQEKRIDWIDVLKGWGIILIVIGHMPIPSVLREWIFSFHVPLFFFVSGYLYKPGKYSFKEWIFRKSKSLLIPYLFFMVLCFATNYFVLGKDVGSMIPKWIIRGCGGWPIWFLYVLFLSELLGDFIYKVTKGKNTPLLLISLFFAAFSYWCYLGGLHLPYKLEVVGISTLYFIVGIIIRQNKLFSFFAKPICSNNIAHFLAIVFLLVIDVICAKAIIPDLNMIDNKLGIHLPTLCLAIIGIYLSIQISLWLMQHDRLVRLFKYAGENSIIILGVSSPIWLTLLTLMKCVPISMYIRIPLILIFMVGGIILAIYMINNYLPFVIGRKKIQSKK